MKSPNITRINSNWIGYKSPLGSSGRNVVKFTPFANWRERATFEQKIGAVGNLVSYEQTNGQFTEEVLVRENEFPLIDAKPGGILRSKIRYLITETDIDTLITTNYQETVIPAIN